MSLKILYAAKAIDTDMASTSTNPKTGDAGVVTISGRGQVEAYAKSSDDDTTGFTLQAYLRPQALKGSADLTEEEEIARDWYADDSDGVGFTVVVAGLTSGNRYDKGAILVIEKPPGTEVYFRVYDITGATPSVDLLVQGTP